MPTKLSRREETRTSCLVVLFKAPDRSKRRLAADLGAEAAVAAAHLLDCVLEDARAWPGQVVLAAAAETDARWLTRLESPPGEVVVQQGGSLGERLNHIDALLRSRGLERLIYVGADCPAMNDNYLARADAAFDDADAILGPALDGGVVLMGARRPWPALGDLAWSTPSLCEDLSERLAWNRWTIARLGTLADVDSVADLEALRETLKEDTRPARVALSAWLHSRDPLRAGA